MDNRDLDKLMNELNKFAHNVSTIGDAVKRGVKEGIKEGNAEERKKKNNTDDSDIAEKANSRLIMRHKEEYSAFNELRKSKEKTPEQEFNERTLKTQSNTSSYLEQLLKLTRENQEGIKKQPNIFNQVKNTRKEPGFLEKTSRMQDSKNPYSKLIGNMADLGLQGKKIFSSVKDRISGSTGRQKQISKYTSDINRDKALLSAEEYKLEKLKNAKHRDEKAIKKAEDSVNKRKVNIQSKSEKFADVTAKEYLHQKAKSDKNFKFKGTEKDLMLDQLRGNILNSTTKDIFSDGKSNKNNSRYKASEGISNKSISIFETQLKDSSNPSTAGEYIVGIYNELRKQKNNTQRIPIKESLSSGGGGMFSMFSKVGPLLSSLAPIAASLAAVGGGALLFNKLQNSLKAVGVGDGGAGGDKVEDLADDAVLKGGKTAMAVGAKKGGAVLAKTAGKTLAKSAVKKIPLVGLGAGALFAAQRAWNGDFAGAGMELASGAAGTIPGIGTAASVGIDAALLARDVYKIKKENNTNKVPKSDSTISNTHTAKTLGKPDSTITNAYTPKKINIPINSDAKSDSTISNIYTPKKTNILTNNQFNNKELVDTKSNAHAMSQYSGIDQMTAMTIQAKLIAMEMMAMNNSSDYINKQKDIMKTAGVSMAEKLYGGG